jgi:hypothetical protein
MRRIVDPVNGASRAGLGLFWLQTCINCGFGGATAELQNPGNDLMGLLLARVGSGLHSAIIEERCDLDREGVEDLGFDAGAWCIAHATDCACHHGVNGQWLGGAWRFRCTLRANTTLNDRMQIAKDAYRSRALKAQLGQTLIALAHKAAERCALLSGKVHCAKHRRLGQAKVCEDLQVFGKLPGARPYALIGWGLGLSILARSVLLLMSRILIPGTLEIFGALRNATW